MAFLVLIGLLCVEIALFVWIGGSLGAGLSVLWCLGTMGLGAWRISSPVMAVRDRRQATVMATNAETWDIFEILATLLGGILLVIPGFLTDFLGLMLFVPFVRSHLKAFLESNAAVRRSPFFILIDAQVTPPGAGVIEGEYKRVDPKRF